MNWFYFQSYIANLPYATHKWLSLVIIWYTPSCLLYTYQLTTLQEWPSTMILFGKIYIEIQFIFYMKKYAHTSSWLPYKCRRVVNAKNSMLKRRHDSFSYSSRQLNQTFFLQNISKFWCHFGSQIQNLCIDHYTSRLKPLYSIGGFEWILINLSKSTTVSLHTSGNRLKYP